LDFSKQSLVYVDDQMKDMQVRLMDFYETAVKTTKSELMKKFPLQPDMKPKVWEKAISARAFDICRGLIPAGVSTYVSWHTTLRHAHDHLKRLRHHSLPEVRDIANETLSQLKTRHVKLCFNVNDVSS
jgi:thymidylate synthase ThyX